jgi:CubicO group peptidase (beta-lactamase class C family)
MKLPPLLDWPSAGIGPGLDIRLERRVTRENWRLYPYSRWAFQHTRELVPSRGLQRSDRPRDLPEHPVSLDGLRFDDGEGGIISWAEFEERTFTDAMIILHKDAIIHERYLNGMSVKTPHHAFSVSKSFVGLLGEMLIADGLLDPDAPVTLYVPELTGSGFATATVRHLLDMTDGVAFDEDYANPDADVHLYSASYWTPAVATGGARETLARLARRYHPPGEAFSYRTPVADALGWAIARASGERLADLFGARLWQPAGCADDGHFLVDTAGDEIAASGLNATARDMARLALLVMEDREIAKDVCANIMRGGNRALFAASKFAGRSQGSYRSQWWVSHDAQRSVAALGVFGQRVHIEMETGLVMVRFGSHPLASNLHTDDLHQRALAALRDFLR